MGYITYDTDASVNCIAQCIYTPWTATTVPWHQAVANGLKERALSQGYDLALNSCLTIDREPAHSQEILHVQLLTFVAIQVQHQ